jgi:hypothetical protein
MSKILGRIHKHKAHDKRYSPFLDVSCMGGGWLPALRCSLLVSSSSFKFSRHSQTKLRGIAWEQSSQTHCGGRLQTRPFV